MFTWVLGNIKMVILFVLNILEVKKLLWCIIDINEYAKASSFVDTVIYQHV